MTFGRLRGRGVALLYALALAGCQPYRTCDPVDEEAIGELPERLSLTGLFAPGTPESIAPDVRGFRPRFELWSDGASKRRWIWLPPGARIDTSDMDSWQFPVGTKLWKEFVRDGTRVETRLLQRLADGWIGVAYVWQSDGTEAIAAPSGVSDVLGTAHDAPASNQCDGCHGGRSSHALGFSAVQLAQPGDGDSLSLDELVQLELVSHAPEVAPRVPGDETEQAALGYLHANCAHCHNASRPERSGARCFDPEKDIDFLLRAGEGPEASETSTYRTAMDICVKPGQPESSKMIELVSKRGFNQMPPLASEVVDEDAVALLRRWIEEM